MASSDDFDYLRDALPARRTGHPDALHWYAMFRHRSPADRRYLVAALRDASSAREPADDDATRAACRETYERYVRETGGTSHHGYLNWHKKQQDETLPTAGQIRHHLGGGSWDVVTDKYGAKPRADASVRQLRALGPFFVEEEVLAPLAVYGASPGWKTLKGFLDFCRRELAKPNPRWVRLPLSASPIHRLFPDGGLREALARLGLEDRHISNRRRAPRRWQHSWDQDEAHPFLEKAVEHLGAGISEETYDRWAQAQRAHLRAQRITQPRVPSSKKIAELFGSFIYALLDLGVVDAVEALKRSSRGGPKLPDDELRAALADAMWEEGDDISPDLYTEVRLRWFTEAVERREVIRVPSETSIRIRIGGESWPAARRAVQQWAAETGYQPRARTAR
jgi:hypothetical protein